MGGEHDDQTSTLRGLRPTYLVYKIHTPKRWSVLADDDTIIDTICWLASSTSRYSTCLNNKLSPPFHLFLLHSQHSRPPSIESSIKPLFRLVRD